MTQKAILYCRVSSKKQTVEGSGLESQEYRCRQYAAAQGYEIENIFKDDVSGGGDFMKRPGMVALLTYLRRHRKTNYVVIFDDLKRFARDTMFHLQLREQFSRYNARIECLNFRFDDTPEGKFVETIHAAQGQLDREQNGRQTIQKMRARLERGYFVFQAPVGYVYKKTPEHGKLLVPVEPQASIIREALNGYASGRFQTQSEVMYFLNSFPEYPKGSNGKVHIQRVYELLTRPIYAGCIEHERWGISIRKGQHRALIDIETFQKIQERLKEGAKAPTRKNINQDFPLRGFIECGDCHEPLTAGWSKGRSKSYPYYLCIKKGCVSYGKSIKRAELEGAFDGLVRSLTPRKPAFKVANKMFKKLWDCRADYQKKHADSLKAKRIDIERKTEKLIDLIVDANSPSIVASYEKRINQLEKEKLLLDEKIEKCGRPITDYNATLRTAMNFLENPHKLWCSERLEDKVAVQKLVFAKRLTWVRNEGLRTVKTTLPFKVLGDISALKNVENIMVPDEGDKSNYFANQVDVSNHSKALTEKGFDSFLDLKNKMVHHLIFHA